MLDHGRCRLQPRQETFPTVQRIARRNQIAILLLANLPESRVTIWCSVNCDWLVEVSFGFVGEGAVWEEGGDRFWREGEVVGL